MLIILGIALILIGALVFAYLPPELIIRLAAGLLVVAGIVLLLLGVFDAADIELARSSWGRAIA